MQSCVFWIINLHSRMQSLYSPSLPSEKAITFIVLRCSMTLMSPALHPAHQTLQEEGRFWGDSVAVEWGQLLPLPVSPILCGKQDVTQRCLMPFPQSD